MDESKRQQVAELAASPDQLEAAQALLRQEGFGVLCTNAIDLPGYPYGSIVQYAIDDHGDAIVLASQLAEHTRNFLADDKVALFVTDSSRPGADPQTMPRVAALGRISSADASDVEEFFKGAHPKSGTYTKLQDFGFYRIRFEAFRYVGGFGRMSWMEPEEESP